MAECVGCWRRRNNEHFSFKFCENVIELKRQKNGLPLIYAGRSFQVHIKVNLLHLT